MKSFLLSEFKYLYLDLVFNSFFFLSETFYSIFGYKNRAHPVRPNRACKYSPAMIRGWTNASPGAWELLSSHVLVSAVRGATIIDLLKRIMQKLVERWMVQFADYYHCLLIAWRVDPLPSELVWHWKRGTRQSSDSKSTLFLRKAVYIAIGSCLLWNKE